jgi:hypothetical protein
LERKYVKPAAPLFLRASLLVALVLGYGGVVLLLSGELQSRLACVIAGACCALAVPLYFAVAIANGYSPTEGGVDYREKSPFAFWVGLTTYTSIFLLFAIAAVAFAAERFNLLGGQ